MRLPSAPASALALLLALAAGALPAQEPRPLAREDVRYPSGELTLAAELLRPADAAGPLPGAVVIQGSGPSDRSNPWARRIAELAARQGVAVLLTDKRGSGESGGDWRLAGFDELANDALAGVALLRGRSGVDPGRVGVVGLSQGGRVAPVAAARSQEVAFVVAVSGSAVSFAEQSYHEMGNTARQAGLDAAGVQGVLDLNRAAGDYLLTGDWERYAAARQRALTTPWRRIAEGFPAAPDLPIWTFLRASFVFDPLPYWVQIEQPVLVVYGADDEADNVPVAESVRRLESAFATAGKRNARIVVIADAGHGLLDHGSGELVPTFVRTLSRWLGQWVTEGVAQASAGDAG